MSSFGIEFSTVRELEKKSFRIFAYGGSGLLAGVVLTVLALGFLGIPLMILSALVILGAIAWVSLLAREPSRPLFCPYCTHRNDVYRSRRSFDCDICGRHVNISESGEPLMAEGIDTEARYDRHKPQ